MCPFCMATMGLVVAGTVSTGGLAALAVRLTRRKNGATKIVTNPNERSSPNGNEHD